MMDRKLTARGAELRGERLIRLAYEIEHLAAEAERDGVTHGYWPIHKGVRELGDAYIAVSQSIRSGKR